MNSKRANPIWLLIIIIVAVVATCSCIKSKLQTNKTYTESYTVDAGKHYSILSIDLIDNPLNGVIITNRSWYWPVPEKNGWSKVTGIGNEQTGEKESNRVVYMVKDIKHDGKIKTAGIFGWYICDNGSCDNKGVPVDTIFDFDKKHKFTFEVGYTGFDKAYLVWDDKAYYEQNVSTTHGIKYLNHPYIGGTYTIPHDWNVNIKFN